MAIKFQSKAIGAILLTCTPFVPLKTFELDVVHVPLKPLHLWILIVDH